MKSTAYLRRCCSVYLEGAETLKIECLAGDTPATSDDIGGLTVGMWGLPQVRKGGRPNQFSRFSARHQNVPRG